MSSLTRNDAVAQKVRGIAEVALQRVSSLWGPETSEKEKELAKELARILIDIGDTSMTEKGAKGYWNLFCKYFEESLTTKEEWDGYGPYKCTVDTLWEKSK